MKTKKLKNHCLKYVYRFILRATTNLTIVRCRVKVNEIVYYTIIDF